MTKERNIKTENTYSILQEEDTELLREEEPPHPKLLKKIKMKRKYAKERKRENKKSLW